jgi:hypothetical protein
MEYLQCMGLEISFALKEMSQEDKSFLLKKRSGSHLSCQQLSHEGTVTVDDFCKLLSVF